MVCGSLVESWARSDHLPRGDPTNFVFVKSPK